MGLKKSGRVLAGTNKIYQTEERMRTVLGGPEGELRVIIKQEESECRKRVCLAVEVEKV